MHLTAAALRPVGAAQSTCLTMRQAQVDVSFNTLLNWDSFSVHIPAADAERLPEILRAIPESRVREMQAREWAYQPGVPAELA